MKFEWDNNKNESNKRKHGVSFEESVSVFLDEDALVRYDPDHSIDEDRFIILGMSNISNLLVVCHCYKEGDSVIRIISAGKAAINETRQYYNY